MSERISWRKIRHLDYAPAEAKLSNTRRDAIAKETFDAFVMDLGLATLQELMEEQVNSLVGVRANIAPITSFIPAYDPWTMASWC